MRGEWDKWVHGTTSEDEVNKDTNDKGGWKQASTTRRKSAKKRRFNPAVATRKSYRMAMKVSGDNMGKAGVTANTGTFQNVINSFTILNSCDNYDLEELASCCDISLGEDRGEVQEVISAMKLEELARAAIAEAEHRLRTEKSGWNTCS